MAVIAICKASEYHSTFNSKVSSILSSQHPLPSFSHFLLFYKFRCWIQLQHANAVKCLDTVLLPYQISLYAIKQKHS